MLYGLGTVLPWRVAALCCNSEHSVPPYNLAGALLLASPLLGECLSVYVFVYVCARHRRSAGLTHPLKCFSACVCVAVCDEETGEGLSTLTD